MSANKIQIAEAGAKAFREGASTGSRREVTIIRAGWGSSGYYSEQVLERDIPRIFPSGSHMYLDHPTESEDAARPERSLRDWVGVTESAPRMAGIDSVATATIFEHWQPVIDGIVNGGGNLGLSIRAFGISEHGNAGGREGPIINRLTEGLSIDYVTLPGAGGSVGRSMNESLVPLIESARLHVPEHLRETLDSELREALDSAGTAAWGGDKIYVYCQDYDVDNSWAIFWVNPDDEESYYYKTQFSRDTQGNVTLTGTPEKVKRDVNYIPTKESRTGLVEEARNAGNYLEALIHRRFTEKADSLFGEGNITRDERISLSSAIGDALEAFAAKLESEAPQLFERDPYEPMEAPEVGYIEEKAKRGSDSRLKEEAKMAEENGLSELRQEFKQLKESMEKRVKEAEDKTSAAETRATEAEARADRAEEKDLKTEAMRISAKVLESAGEKLSDKAKGRIIEAATRGDLPMDGEKLDESIVQERTRARAREELEYLGEALGTGKVEGAGGTGELFSEAGGSVLPDLSDPPVDKALVEAFKSQGMSDEAAQRAAEGR